MKNHSTFFFSFIRKQEWKKTNESKRSEFMSNLLFFLKQKGKHVRREDEYNM